MSLSKNQLVQESALLAHCKANQGPAINVLNAHRAPCATTYRQTFCAAAADLICLYRSAEVQNPVVRLSEQFMKSGIVSCRGNDMSLAVTDYLYRKFLLKLLRGNEYRVLLEITTERCPICNRRKKNLAAHMRDAHPTALAASGKSG